MLPRREILDAILAGLAGLTFELRVYTLTCAPEALRARMLQDGRSEEAIAGSVERLALYERMDSVKVDTARLTPAEVAEQIRASLSTACCNRTGSRPDA